MYSIIRLAVLVTIFFASILSVPAHAQDGMKRTILHQADLSGAPGMEVISSILEVEPGATVPRHFHNGIETGRALEGGMIQLPGKEPEMLASGNPIFNLRNAMHAGWKNVGDKPIKLYTGQPARKARVWL